ncbi:MAG TPA: Yip1 family protein [Gemmatimonadaceae bacterium]|nr:Yip1 family protein [Gemmatimonadaceae bacterium]
MTEPSMSRGPELDAPAPAKQEKASILDDFMDIFYAPSTVFARRENAGFWIPLLIVTVLTGVIFIANRDLIEPIMEAEMTRAMAKNSQQLTPEQMEGVRKMGGVFGTIGAFVFTPVTLLALGIVIWIVGKFVDAKQTMNAAINVAVFSYVPRIIEGIVNRAQSMLIDTSTINSRYSLTLGVGRFLDADTTSPILLGLVGRIDLFTIWVTVLIAIGLAVTGKISRGRAAIAAVAVWLIGALPTLAGALRQ